jgi:hypothetical protein
MELESTELETAEGVDDTEEAGRILKEARLDAKKAERKVVEAERKVVEAERKVVEAERKVEAARRDAQEAERKLEKATGKCDEVEKNYEEAERNLQAAKTDTNHTIAVEEAERQLAHVREAQERANKMLETTLQMLETTLQMLETTLCNVNTARRGVDEAYDTLDRAKRDVDDAQARLRTAEVVVNEARQGLMRTRDLERSMARMHLSSLDNLLMRAAPAPSGWFDLWKNRTPPECASVLEFHRPDKHSGVVCMPVTLLSPVFGEFRDALKSEKVSKQDCEVAIDLCRVMSIYYATEKDRESALCPVLNRLVPSGFQLQSQHSASVAGVYKSDLVLLQSDNLLVLNVKVKNESGEGGGDSTLQNIGYYWKYLEGRHQKNIRMLSYPCLLVEVVGSRLGVSGCMIAMNRVVVDPLTALIPLIDSAGDLRFVTEVAHVVHALRMTIATLWIQPVPIQTDFPYPVSYALESGVGRAYPFSFRYKKCVGKGKLVFLAEEMQSDSNSKTHTPDIIVKFTRMYAPGSSQIEVHKFCSEAGFAPKLYAVNVLSDGWNMVVMEYLEEVKNAEQGKVSEAIAKLKEFVKDKLSRAGYVHGDLRRPNVILTRCKESGDLQAKLIDFDWAGKAGKDLYPLFINHAGIRWPQGMEEGRPLNGAFDAEMLDQMDASYWRLN